MNRKTVDIYEYMALLRELTEQGKEVSLLLTGNSMVPFLCDQRDYIFFRKPDRPLRKGDMVFYRRSGGRYVMHRICRVCPDGSFDLVGDGQWVIEHGVRQEQIFGLITKVRRKGKLLTDGDFLWEFFRVIWIRLIPLRSPLMRLYTGLRKIFCRRREKI